MSTIIDFNNHEERITSLESGGGIFDNISCNSLYTKTRDATYIVTLQNEGNIIFGGSYNNTIKFDTFNNVAIVGRNTTIDGLDGIITYNNGVIIGGTNVTDTRPCGAGINIFGQNYKNGTGSISGGVTICGAGSTVNSYYGSTIIAGNRATINGTATNVICGEGSTINGFTGTLICGKMSTVKVSNPHFKVVSNEPTFIDNESNGFIYCVSNSNSFIKDSAVKNRKGLILLSQEYNHNLNTDKTFKIYYPSELNYSAQTYGYVRYTNQMNITDPDGEYIIKDGRLALEEKVKQLEEEIAALKQLLNN